MDANVIVAILAFLGTALKVWENRQAARDARANATPPVSLQKPAERPRVLIVDDVPDTMGPLEYILQQEGYQVSTAPSAEDALQQHIFTRFDLLILDHAMPGKTGLSLARRVRRLEAQEGAARARIVFFTGNPKSVDDALDEVDARLWVKPLGEEEIRRLARAELARR